MGKYEVVGPRKIRGVAKGGVVDIEDDKQADRLTKAGHIKKHTPTPAMKKADISKES